MKCPKCRAELKKVKRGDVVVDACDLCYGIWLDKGELELISSRDSSDLEKSAKIIKKLSSADVSEISEDSYSCPICNKTMEKIRFDLEGEVVADRCLECGGIWFDSGEMISVADTVNKEKERFVPSSSKTNVSLLPSFLALIGVFVIIGVIIILILKLFK